MILLDTCAIVWDALDRARLTEKAVAAIQLAQTRDALRIADISIWEIAMLAAHSRIQIEASASDFISYYLQSRNISVIAISPDIAELSTRLGPEINNDPADRIIAATSILHHAQLITADANLRQASAVDTLW